MMFVKNLGIAAAVVVAAAITVAVVCFATGAGVQIPWLLEAPPRRGGAPSLTLSVEPLGLVALTVAVALLLTGIRRLRSVPSHS